MHTRIFSVIPRGKFLFSFRQVERSAVGLGVSRYQIDDESHHRRDVSLEDVPPVLLIRHNLLDVHCPAQDNHSQNAQADGKLVADNHRPASHGAYQRILAVAAPSRQQDAQHTDGRSRQHEEDTDVHVQNLSPLVPWQTRECQYRRHDHQERSQTVQELVRVFQRDNLFRQNLYNVRRNLQKSSATPHTVRSDTALESRAHLTLHIYQDDGQHGIHHHDEHPHGNTLYSERHPFGHQAAQGGMYPHQERLKIIIVKHFIQSIIKNQ